ncbi:MAG TPA: hypothetical protein VH475_01295 [Tepidisphaeraceae bacterium]
MALWANAALLAMVLLVLLNRGGAPSFLPTAYAQNQGPIAGGAGVFVMPAQMAVNVWGCYLLDVDNKTLCAYQFYPGEKKLRLTAARSYRFDTKLENFNTDIPPREVKAMIERQQAADAGGGGAGAGAANDNKDKDTNK